MRKDELDPNLKNIFENLKQVPERDPQVVANGRANFLRQAAVLKAEKHQKSWINQLFPFIFITPNSPRLRPIVAVILVITMIFGGSAATVYAAQGSLPDQPLYKVKTWSEDLLLSVTYSPQSQLDQNLNFADRRILEIAGMHAAGTPIPQHVQTRLQVELDQVLKLAAGMDDQHMITELERISLRAEVQFQMMSMLMAGDPNSPDPVLEMVRTSLQKQLQLTAQGMGDVQGFRKQFQDQIHNTDLAPSQDRVSGTVGYKYSKTTTPLPSRPFFSGTTTPTPSVPHSLKTNTPFSSGPHSSKTTTPSPSEQKFNGTSTGEGSGNKNYQTITPMQNGNGQKTPTQDKGKKP